MNPHTSSFIKLMKHPVKFRMFLFSKLPAAFFSGLRVKEVDAKHCVVTVPYKWFTKNPFRSTYFACLSMAGEMSTGALAMAHLYKINPRVSMLVIKVESEYFKKAVGRTSFICQDGELIEKAIEETIANKEARIVRTTSVGTDSFGEIVARFFITWSFKVK